MHAAIATVTFNPALDTSTQIDHVVPEKKLRCETPRHEPGGGGINVARAIYRLGGQARAVYTRGGPFGALLDDLLAQESVAQCPIPIADNTRQSFVVLDKTSGQQYRFSVPGPELAESELERVFDTLRNLDPVPAYLVASGSLTPGAPQDSYARLARLCRELGSRFILDSYGEPLRQAVEAGVFLLKPNMRELKHLAGEEIESERQQEAVVHDLVKHGKVEVVVVSLGAAGALFATSDEMRRIRAPTVNIQSKIGAGDSMVGGITLALARGMSLQEAAYFGVAAGSAAVMTPGTELCRREDTERLYAKMQGEEDV
ncbi:MAG: 1-phosphofructokinase family hexose kinase [Anaerolineae bacterium]|nr:1-phosphofructokinase family hexose kinase [Anaerolineae bacterium]